jgi:hypothetical protein
LNILKKESFTEKISGNPTTESALTLISALSGNPVSALLPLLSNSLANGRHKKRVEAALTEVNKILAQHEEKIRSLTDGQYKLINETILSFLQTTSSKKINYLKNVIRNTLKVEETATEDGVFLSRTIRDISADEILFLLKHFLYEKIQIGNSSSTMPRNVLTIKSNSKGELICSGLISLGLIVPSGPTFDDQGLWRFSGLVAKLIVLLQD